MKMFGKAYLIIILLNILLAISCGSSSHTTKMRKREGQCDCPKTEKVRKPAKYNSHN
jgi:hypothetical protein